MESGASVAFAFQYFRCIIAHCRKLKAVDLLWSPVA
jgi:hypothetical protein